MFKMGSHDPFGYLKHKLWPKEGSWVKLPIWLLTTKSQKSPWFPYFQMACHIPLESSWWRLQLCFRPHFNRGFAHKIMGPPKLWKSHIKEFRDSNLRISGQNDIWVLAPWPDTNNIIRGEGGGFPQVRAVMSFLSSCLFVVRPCTKNAPTIL